MNEIISIESLKMIVQSNDEQFRIIEAHIGNEKKLAYDRFEIFLSII
jgi:hypothetical protein